ncbi:serine/threonine-protein kinase [Streptomyces sp. NPDC048604]|uniref:serine/threonine-protein kinase n=1 Tax=Streptomyces sp. NPDC048604 TaxID=3365578 RepID=UPI003711DAF3
MSSGENQRLAGRYRVVRQLGRGGMGVVWRAVDEVLGREVAVKELRTYNDSSGQELADLHLRMQREARAAARVRHPGVVAVHDVADHEGRPVIVMELIDGPSLADVLTERGGLEPREAARIGAAVLEALAAAHDAGVLHRDVKPGNILLDSGGRVVLTDFGIAAMDDPGDGAATQLTRSGEIVGSLDFLAPERAQGQQPGPASDVWAVGATLYAALEGASPFRRTSTWSTLNAIVVEPLPEPRRAGALAPVLRQLMHKDPAERPDARTAARLLIAAAEDRGPADAVPPPAPTAGPAPVPTEVDTAQRPPAGFGPALPPAAAGFPPPGPYASQAGPHAGVQGGAPAGPPAGPVGAQHVTAPRGPRPDPVRRKRAAAPVAAAVAAGRVGGGGITYTLVQRDSGERKEQLAGSEAEPTGPGAEPGRALDPGGSDAPASAAPSGKPSKGAPRDSAKPTPSKPGSQAPKPGGVGDTGGRSTGGGGADGGATASSGGGGDTGGDTGGGSTTTGGGGTDPQPAPACTSIGGGKYNCTVWRTEKTYRHDGGEMGVLNAGTNYFYCQVDLGRRETYGKWTNVWWARTDDDSGNTNVYFSVVYIKGGDNDSPIPGLRIC